MGCTGYGDGRRLEGCLATSSGAYLSASTRWILECSGWLRCNGLEWSASLDFRRWILGAGCFLPPGISRPCDDTRGLLTNGMNMNAFIFIEEEHARTKVTHWLSCSLSRSLRRVWFSGSAKTLLLSYAQSTCACLSRHQAFHMYMGGHRKARCTWSLPRGLPAVTSDLARGKNVIHFISSSCRLKTLSLNSLAKHHPSDKSTHSSIHHLI